MKVQPAAANSISKELQEKKTPWGSLWLSYLIQALTATQYSIYLTSMWPYFSSLDENADLAFFGWITATYSFGQMLACWVFGYWNQKTMSTIKPACCGLVLMAIGNFVYGILPTLPSNYRWYMLAARFVAGIGSGNAVTLRTYCAMASTPADKSRAMSLAIGAYVVGFSIGPALQALFTPIGKDGFAVGIFMLSMYTTPAILMGLTSLISLFLLLFFFVETYSGIITEKEKTESFMVIPQYDHIAAFFCIYLWFMKQSLATMLEIIATPFTIALYKWTDSQAIFYNGILQFLGCFVDVSNYLLMGYTRIGKLDKRKMFLFSIACFLLFFTLTMPWPFYDGPLEYINMGNDSLPEDTSVAGGCLSTYTWCAHTKRVPLPVYLSCFTVVSGFAFPYLAAPLGIVFSEILGPRKQGMMQGLFEFGGCIARCVTPIFVTTLFEESGYVWPTAINLAMVLIALFFVLLLYRRLVPLKLLPPNGLPARYKAGVFYHL
uniref:Major facilitator superfamily domain-containing protein 8 n=1 Tax=Ascaris suum TaxID=6253 RepID=F1L2H8_ASCSU